MSGFENSGESGTGVRVADVALDARSGGAAAVYTYRADADAAAGDAVLVPLGSRMVLGFVMTVYETSAESLGFPVSHLRSLGERVEDLSLPDALIDLSRFVAEETLTPLPVALSSAVPPGIRLRLTTAWTPTEAAAKPPKLTPATDEILRALKETGEILEKPGKKLEPGALRALRSLRTKGLVKSSLRIDVSAERRVKATLLRLTSDAARVDAFLLQEGRRKPAQALTIMRLQEGEHAQLSASELRALAGVTETTVKALIEAGLLEAVDEDAPRPERAHEPNRHQQLAIDAIAEAVARGEARTFLLYGVTGSGKTEVYLRAAAEALRRGRQVLFLVPEIALATQAIARLRERFGGGVAVLHSDLPPAERLRNWLRIRSGDASIVLGARSALFAPMANVGLIVMDEEHEAAYKQESAPRYHAKSLAQFLGRRHGCPVVLGSATPSMESFYEAEQGEDRGGPSAITLLSLPVRAASAQLPEVDIQDLTVGYRHGTPSLLTDYLHRRIEATLAKGEQVILFLNRRSYAPFMICRDCGHRMECPHCAISLSFHRRDGRLRCHHCGYQIRPPETCPSCGGVRLSPLGIGTERLEESVASMFPQAKVARLDRDVARRKGALEETLAAFRSGEIQILVGTQMVAKGLDFPNVTLVGAILADMSLNIPDFRSSERTFQLLCQVAGRSGRGAAHGSVVVQTFLPGHPAVVAARTHDFLSFYEALLVERREAAYPPFRRLVNVELSGEARAAVVRAADEAYRRLKPTGAERLGPVDCAIERLSNRWRMHILMKLPPYAPVAPIGAALADFIPEGVQVTVDVDPYSVM